jgi:hypothetical protein
MLGAGQAGLEKSAHCVYARNEKPPQVPNGWVVVTSAPVHRSSPHACAEIARYEHHTKWLLSPVCDLSRRRPSLSPRSNPAHVHAERINPTCLCVQCGGATHLSFAIARVNVSHACVSCAHIYRLSSPRNADRGYQDHVQQAPTSTRVTRRSVHLESEHVQ